MNNNILTEELKIKGKKMQKIQMIFGIVCLIIFFVIALNTKMFVDDTIHGISGAIEFFSFFFVVASFFLAFLLFFGISYLSSTSKDNYSYLRVSDLLIIFIHLLQFFLGIIILLIGFYLLCYFEIASILTIMLLAVFGNLLYLFLINDDNFRGLYFFLVRLFKLDDSDFDKRLSNNVDVVYYPSEKRYIYCTVSKDGDIITHSSNSFDSFRHGFSSQINFVDFPVSVKLFKIHNEGKKNKKKFKCSKLSFKVFPTIDENKNFRYEVKYCCKFNKEKYLNLIETEEMCKTCPLRKK